MNNIQLSPRQKQAIIAGRRLGPNGLAHLMQQAKHTISKPCFVGLDPAKGSNIKGFTPVLIDEVQLCARLADSLRPSIRQLRQSMAACEIMVKGYLKNNPEFLENIQKLNDLRGGLK